MADPLPDWYKSDSAFPMYHYLSDQGFPTVTQLRQGITMGCIAGAFWLASNAGEGGESWWEGDTYVDDNFAGERWAVAFTEAGTVAVFYTNETERNPYPAGSPPYDQDRYFRGMPDHLLPARQRALSWMVDLDWVMGGPNAVITAAMWSEGERFTAAESWAGVFRHSAWACYKQLLPQPISFLEWQEYCGLTESQTTALRSLYERRVASPDTMITLDPWERATMGTGQIGLAAAREALGAIGIAIP